MHLYIVALALLLLEPVVAQNVTSSEAEDGTDKMEVCTKEYACEVKGSNLLGHFNISEYLRNTIQGLAEFPSLSKNIQNCQKLCQAHPECRHFTWYDSGGTFPYTCYLYSRCHNEDRNTACRDCFSGPRDCKPANKPCSAIGADFGGTWFCFPELYSMHAQVDHGTRCIFQCPQHMTYHVCHDGEWSRPPGEKRCTCEAVGKTRNEQKEGKILCWPPQDLDEPSHAGTYCIHACHGHPKDEFKCHHGHWSKHPTEMSCERGESKDIMEVPRTSTTPSGRAITISTATTGDDLKREIIYHQMLDHENDYKKPQTGGAFIDELHTTPLLPGDLSDPLDLSRLRPSLEYTYKLLDLPFPITKEDLEAVSNYRAVTKAIDFFRKSTTTPIPGKTTRAADDENPVKPTLISDTSPSIEIIYKLLSEQDLTKPPPTTLLDDLILSASTPSDAFVTPEPPMFDEDMTEQEVAEMKELMEHFDLKPTSFKPIAMTTTPMTTTTTTTTTQRPPAIISTAYVPTLEDKDIQFLSSAFSSRNPKDILGAVTKAPEEEYSASTKSNTTPDTEVRHFADEINAVRDLGPLHVDPEVTARVEPISLAHVLEPKNTRMDDGLDTLILSKVFSSTPAVPNKKPKGIDPEDDSHYTYKVIQKQDLTKKTKGTTPMTPSTLEVTADATTSKIPDFTYKILEILKENREKEHREVKIPEVKQPKEEEVKSLTLPPWVAQNPFLSHPSLLHQPQQPAYLAVGPSSPPYTLTGYPTAIPFLPYGGAFPPLHYTATPEEISTFATLYRQHLLGREFDQKHDKKDKKEEKTTITTTTTTTSATTTTPARFTSPQLLVTDADNEIDIQEEMYLDEDDSFIYTTERPFRDTTLDMVDEIEAGDNISASKKKQKAYRKQKKNRNKEHKKATDFYHFTRRPSFSSDEDYYDFGTTVHDQMRDFSFPEDKSEHLFESIDEARRRKSQRKRKIIFQSTDKPDREEDSDNAFWSHLTNREMNSLDWQPGIPNFQLNNNENNKNDDNREHFDSCLHPAPITNGKIHCQGPQNLQSRFAFGATCYVTCDPGYASVGHDYATCGPKGTWLSDAPLQCEQSMAFVIGGWNLEEGTLDDVELFDAAPGSNCGRFNIAPLPEPRRGLVAAWINGQVALVLACGGVNETSQHNLCWAYSPETNRWREAVGGGMLTERHFAGASVAKGTLYVTGGRDGREMPMAIGSVESHNLGHKKEEHVLRLTQERAYHCASTLGDDVLVLTGGYSFNSVVDLAEIFNLTQDFQWSQTGNQGRLNQARYLHACSAIPLTQNRFGILVAGGYGTDYLDSAELYDPSIGDWIMTPGHLSVPRQGARMVVLGGKPTILGGFHSMKEFPTTVEQFDVETGRWRLHPNKLQTPRRYFAVANVPRSLFGRC